jgi:hypothetical protein
MSTAENGKAFNLDDHRDPVAAIIEVKGAKHELLKPKRRHFQAMSNLETKLALDLYPLVQELMPTLPDDVLGDFDKETCLALIAIAGSGIGIVEKLFPNAASPERSGSTSPG